MPRVALIVHVTCQLKRCLWMMPRDPDADMCPSTETVLVSTEERMAHQSGVPSADHDGERSNCGAGTRARSQVCV